MMFSWRIKNFHKFKKTDFEKINFKNFIYLLKFVG